MIGMISPRTVDLPYRLSTRGRPARGGQGAGGADVVYDAVGGAAFDAALRATNPKGRLLPIDFASGAVPQIPANILLVKNLTVIGLHLGAYAGLRPDVPAASFARLFACWEGRLTPHVSCVPPLEEAEAGLELLLQPDLDGQGRDRVAD
ncbi:MAG: zinc-binding dehydrogenase [Rhodobacteraceae bacterium]|nr:zinc-binding dehydrogenase [Paracoccaceae bacterium]